MKTLSAQELLAQEGIESYRNATVLGALPDAAILWLLEKGKIQAMDEGENLFTPGQPGNSFHVVLQGRVSYHKHHQGKSAFIRDFERGEQIGFMSLIALHDRVGRAECHAGTLVLEIDSGVFNDFHSEHPLEFGILMMNLAREMARSLRVVDNLLVEKS